MDVFEAIYTCRSIRRFRPDPVPVELVDRAIEAATMAPSGTNAQSWRFLVIRDADLRARLGELYRRGFREAYPPDRVAGANTPTLRRVLT